MKPIIGITYGEPTGIGPEVLAKALEIEEVYQLCHPIVFGDRGVFKQAMDDFGLERPLMVVTENDLKERNIGEKSFLSLKWMLNRRVKKP